MIKKISIIGFWEGFNYFNNCVTDIFKDYQNITVSNDIYTCDLIIIGSFIKK